MTADRIADSGVRRSITFSRSSTGWVPANIAGMIAKYFATSFAIENVVRAPTSLVAGERVGTRVLRRRRRAQSGSSAQLRRKIEADPARPTIIGTDPGIGYRWLLQPSEQAVTQGTSSGRRL